MIEVTCALIIDDQNRLLAVQRSNNMSLPLKWELPGGKIEPGETLEECIIREIDEELNIEIKIIEQIKFNIHSYPSITIKLIPFICKYFGGQVTLKEHANFKWLNKNELLDLDWAEADIPIINTYFKT
jgi:8-oxo-dGTP diphosphatase